MEDYANLVLLGKFVSLTMQLIAVLLVAFQTPTIVLVLAGFAYVFGLLEGLFCWLHMVVR